jgi:uncharacterized membrane protein
MTSENIFKSLARQDLNPSDKIVLIALQGCGGLTIDALVPVTGLSRATCYRTVKRLRQMNEIPSGTGPAAAQ